MGIHEVTAGSAWLDSNFPGWEREIDLGTLNLMDYKECVLGQSLRKYALTNGYEYGQNKALGLEAPIHQRAKWAATHGFLWDNDEPLWVELIKERFSSGNLSDG